MRWSEDLTLDVDAHAKALGVTRTDYVVRALEQAMGSQPAVVEVPTPRVPPRQKPPVAPEPEEKCDHPMWRRMKGQCLGCGTKV